VVLAPDLRGTGETRPVRAAVAQAPDHNSAEHALWIGRPLLGQWVCDVLSLLDWMTLKTFVRPPIALVGLGQAGIVALCAGGYLNDRVASTAAIGLPVTYITGEAYAPGTHMGLLAPGILRVGDVPHLAALCAPRKLLVAEGVSPQGKKLTAKEMTEAFRFTRSIYRLHKRNAQLKVWAEARAADLAAAL
jgi:pimeloyl-ACP methyl ester carboxylesterase